MLTIDGSFGEGGGQIIRSSLALSLVTGKPITIHNIRAGRKKPGLMQQHLTAVKAAARISAAETKGVAIGSSCLSFVPGPIAPGEYSFRVGTAGSTTLVLQTVLPALLLAEGDSTLRLEGGTHNPFAPPFDFLATAYVPCVNRMGPQIGVKLERHGFYPAGGGRMVVQVQPAARLAGFDLLERGEVVRRRVRALVSNLPVHIARRECDTIARHSGWEPACFEVEEIRDAVGPGNVVLIEIHSTHAAEVFTGFGKRGVPAEQVAADVWHETEAYLDSGVPVGSHLADQILLPLGLAAHAGQGGAFRTLPLTNHALTHLEILRRFLEIHVEVTQIAEQECVVRLSG